MTLVTRQTCYRSRVVIASNLCLGEPTEGTALNSSTGLGGPAPTSGARSGRPPFLHRRLQIALQRILICGPQHPVGLQQAFGAGLA